MNEINIIKINQVPTQQKQCGMLLIEVLFSILIFSFGILGLVGMQAISTKNAMGAEDRTIAASLANDMVAQMWLRKSTDVTTAPLKTDYTAWKTKITNTKGWVSASGTVATDVTVPTAPLTTVTVNWSTAPTSKASGGSTSSPVAHQYVTSFSM
jgi:type IV pilus assembly protein PilV